MHQIAVVNVSSNEYVPGVTENVGCNTNASRKQVYQSMRPYTNIESLTYHEYPFRPLVLVNAPLSRTIPSSFGACRCAFVTNDPFGLNLSRIGACR